MAPDADQTAMPGSDTDQTVTEDKKAKHDSSGDDDLAPGELRQQPPPQHAGPPPNGGLLAWLHVVGGFMLFFNTWGLLNTFGVYQTYYESGALFRASSSDISWIGSIQAFLAMLVGVVAGPIYDRGYLRTLLVVGSLAIVLGQMMLSLCTRFWQVLLAQGFCVGIGAGCIFVPCVSILPTYFSTRLGLAIGVASSGSSLGGVIYPIVLYRLLERTGFPWATRVLGFLSLGTLLVPIAIMRMRVRPPKPRAVVDWTAFRDAQYMVFVVATMIGFIGMGILLFYISFYPQQQRLTSTRLAFYVVPIFNAASCLGRVVPNAVSDRIGPFNTLAPCALVTGVLIFCMMAVHSEAAVLALAVLSGFFSGVFIAMPPVCLAVLTENKALIGTRIGMGFGIISFGMLAGGPGGGGVLGTQDPLEWKGLWAFGGAATCVAGLLYAGIRVARSGPELWVRR